MEEKKLKCGCADRNKKLKIQGAEELFMLIDKEYESFIIDKGIGEILQKYRNKVLRGENY